MQPNHPTGWLYNPVGCVMLEVLMVGKDVHRNYGRGTMLAHIILELSMLSTMFKFIEPW